MTSSIEVALPRLGRLRLDDLGLRRQLRHRHEGRAVPADPALHHRLRTLRRAIALRYGPDTYAARNRSRVWVSALRYPWPGPLGSS